MQPFQQLDLSPLMDLKNGMAVEHSQFGRPARTSRNTSGRKTTLAFASVESRGVVHGTVLIADLFRLMEANAIQLTQSVHRQGSSHEKRSDPLPN